MYQPICTRSSLYYTILFLVALFPLAAIAGVNEAREALKIGDTQTALAHLLPLANAGDSEAQYLVGSIYNIPSAPPEYIKEAAKWFTEASKTRHPYAMFALGVLFFHGQGVENDPDKALALLLAAEQLGVKETSYYIGSIYEHGTKTVKSNPDEALKMYQKGVANNDSTSMIAMGVAYFDGRLIQRDIKKAISLFEQAAQLGNKDAFLNLGIVYEFGRGVDIDLARAASYYAEGIRYGSEESKANLEELTRKNKPIQNQ